MKTGRVIGFFLLLFLFCSACAFSIKECINLGQTLSFYLQSEDLRAKVTDVREGTVDDFAVMLPSGKLLWKDDSYYRPLICYTHPRTQNMHVQELSDASASDYAITTELPIRVSLDDAKLVRESHGFFLWGRAAIMTPLGMLSILIFYILLRRSWRAGKSVKGRGKATKGRARARKTPANKTAPAKKKG